MSLFACIWSTIRVPIANEQSSPCQTPTSNINTVTSFCYWKPYNYHHRDLTSPLSISADCSSIPPELCGSCDCCKYIQCESRQLCKCLCHPNPCPLPLCTGPWYVQVCMPTKAWLWITTNLEPMLVCQCEGRWIPRLWELWMPASSDIMRAM